ncbi:hypothetical protein ES707_04750 [subsurface metagenome]
MLLPDIENVKIAYEIYQEQKEWVLAEKIVTSFFANNKSNKDESSIFLKVKLLNSLYNTNVFAIRKMARHILHLNADNDLKSGKIEIVEKIANLKLEKDKSKRFISFASKYCHFHEPHKYAIYDKFALRALIEIIGSPNKKMGRDYRTYFEAIKDLKNNLQGVSFVQIDRYLWLYGQYIKKDKKSYGVQEALIKFFNREVELCKKLIPRENKET